MKTEILFEMNPWISILNGPLNSGPFVAADDREFVEDYNREVKPENRFHVDLFPEQYAGNFEAPVVLLGKCPGFKPGDAKVHASDIYKNLWRKNVTQENIDYPLFFLHPKIEGTPCEIYWYRKLKPLIERTSRELVAKHVLEVQLYPYHCGDLKENEFSKSFPSRKFANEIVNFAVERGAIIIAMMKKNDWGRFVPSLGSYNNFHAVNNPRSASVSPKNLPGIFNDIADAVSRGYPRQLVSGTNKVNGEANDLPAKKDADQAIEQLRSKSRENPPVEKILNQIEKNFFNQGKSLKSNWRIITERNIREYWYK